MSWMRQDSEKDTYQSNQITPSTPSKPVAQATPASAPASSLTQPVGMGHMVNLGKSVFIKGELSGDEDLVIEGKVEGKVDLKEHTLTIGTNAQIKGEVFAKTVHVLGEIIGNLTALDRVEIADSGSMQGDIKAPRVVLADGARFKGRVDMEVKPGSTAKPAASYGEAQKAKAGTQNVMKQGM